jgi:hypothetical protein
MVNTGMATMSMTMLMMMLDADDDASLLLSF